MSGLSLPLTEAEEHFLLDCARASIRRGVRLPLPEDFAFLNGDGEPDSRAMEQTLLAAQARAPRLLTPSGAFVTLHGTATGVPMLRGCIGLMEPVMPLALAVLRMGWAAAFSDYRFSPLRAAEVPDLELDISVLGPLSPAAPEDIELGRHGVKLDLQLVVPAGCIVAGEDLPRHGAVPGSGRVRGAAGEGEELGAALLRVGNQGTAIHQVDAGFGTGDQ